MCGPRAREKNPADTGLKYHISHPMTRASKEEKTLWFRMAKKIGIYKKKVNG